MGIKNFLQSRRDDAELGRGLWRRAHDRFIRGVDRFHQVLERLAHTDMVELVVPSANCLSDLIPRVRAIAMEAQRLAPSEGTDVPSSPTGVYSDVHRALSKAGELGGPLRRGARHGTLLRRMHRPLPTAGDRRTPRANRC